MDIPVCVLVLSSDIRMVGYSQPWIDEGATVAGIWEVHWNRIADHYYYLLDLSVQLSSSELFIWVECACVQS